VGAVGAEGVVGGGDLGELDCWWQRRELVGATERVKRALQYEGGAVSGE
jgi:hypothetical protein